MQFFDVRANDKLVIETPQGKAVIEIIPDGHNDRVKLGIAAPREIKVDREELRLAGRNRKP